MVIELYSSKYIQNKNLQCSLFSSIYFSIMLHYNNARVRLIKEAAAVDSIEYKHDD